MDFVLHDDHESWKGFLPLTFTRPLSELRIGILTIKEKWDRHLATVCGYHTENYLSKKFPSHSGAAIYICSTYCPDTELVAAIKGLKEGEALLKAGNLIAYNGSFSPEPEGFKKIEYPGTVFEINHLWDLFQKNAEAIKADFDLITKGRKSRPLSSTVTVIGDKSQIFLEEGAMLEACILNVKAGPIYIGKDAEIMEGSAIRGPLAEHENLRSNYYWATLESGRGSK